MCSAFRMGPVSTGLGPGDFDRVIDHISKKILSNWVVLQSVACVSVACRVYIVDCSMSKIYRYFGFFGLYYNRYVLVVSELPNFLTLDLLTLNYTV